MAPTARVVYGLDAAAWQAYHGREGVQLLGLGDIGPTWDIWHDVGLDDFSTAERFVRWCWLSLVMGKGEAVGMVMAEGGGGWGAKRVVWLCAGRFGTAFVVTDGINLRGNGNGNGNVFFSSKVSLIEDGMSSTSFFLRAHTLL